MRRFKQYAVKEYLDYLKSISINRNINQIHLHHAWKPTKKAYNEAANKEGVIFGMWSYHTKQLGWSDIGQHISLAPDGTIWDGRSLEKDPASIKGHNKGAFAIEVIGNFDIGYEKLEGKQLDSLVELLRGLFDIFNTNNLIFHREFSSKTCPGTSVIKEDILSLVEGRRVAIMGDSVATKEQMKKYLLLINPNPQINCTVDELINFYLEEGEVEGVRGDIAFAQSLKETGYFKYGGIVQPWQNNFAGIGALNNNSKGECATFPSPRIGIRAQIQHLKGYASTERPKKEIVDPRYQILVDKNLLGTAPYVTDLNGKWAWPGTTYGQGILEILDKILVVKIEKNDANDIIAEKDIEIEKLKAENIILRNKIEQIKAII